MKKVTKLSLALAAALAFGCAAVACDDGDPEKKPNPQEPPKYTVSYAIGTGATGTAPASFQKSKDQKFNLETYDAATATFSKEGSTFDGWLCSADNIKYDGGVEYTMPDKNVTFTAQWVLNSGTGEDEDTYTITYDLNGGKGTTPTEAAQKENAKITLASDDGFSKTGFTFAGWNDGKATYTAGTDYTVGTANVTFVAQWAPTGISLPEEDILEYEGDCTLPSKSFAGRPIGGENIVGIAIDTEKGDLYYKLKGSTGWEKSKTKYSAANRVGLPDKYGDSAPYYEGKIGEVNYNALFKPDYSELTLCDTDDNILENGVFTMVSQEAPHTVTVTFDINWITLGVDNPPEQKLANGATATEPSVPDRDGYDFGGWRVDTENGTPFDFDAPVTGDVKLVANWTPKPVQYTVTFTAPTGATGDAPETITVDAGKTYTIPANTFTKTGWTFYKWKNVSTGAYVTATMTYSAKANIEYVAVFQSDSESYAMTGGYYDTLVMLDDGNIAMDGYPSSYEENDDGTLLIDDLYVAKLDTIAKTGVFCDDLRWISKEAENGATLSFDGYGVATLDGHTGTYSLVGNYTHTLTLTFGETTISDIEVEESGFYGITDIVLNTTITIDGTDYVFGTGGGDEEPDAIPERLYGTFEGTYPYGYPTKYSVTVSADGVTITIGSSGEAVEATGVVYKLDSWANKTYDSLKFSADGTEYEIINETLSGTVSTVTLWINDSYDFDLDRVGGSEEPETPEIPAAFVGTYEATKDGKTYVVTITADAITVKIGDDDAVTAEITEYDDSEGFTVNLGADEWSIQQAGYGDTVDSVMLATADYSVYVTCARKAESPEEPEDPEEIPERLYGTYQGSTLTGAVVKYSVTVSADGVTISIADAAAVDATEVTYELDKEYGDYETISFKAGGKRYELENDTLDGDVQSVYLYVYSGSDLDQTARLYRKVETIAGDKLYDYGGVTSANGITYGYASSSDATDAFSLAYTSGGTTSSKTFYWAKVYYNAPTATSNPNKLFIYIYYTASIGVSTTTMKDGDSNVAITDTELPSSQTVQVTTTSSFGGVVLDVNFSIIDGKRAMTITYGEGQSVTWYEFTA